VGVTGNLGFGVDVYGGLAVGFDDGVAVTVVVGHTLILLTDILRSRK
jgi:hypothetical protein